MIFRRLKIGDAPYMLEWMKDSSITSNFRTDFSTMELTNVEDFIKSSLEDKENIHFCVANDDDEYLGTISLKNIDQDNKNAEYAICLRKKAQGTNAASFGTQSLLSYAFNDIGLHRVYLNVYTDNERANAFYIKAGFNYEGKSVDSLRINGIYKSLNWYAKVKE